VAFTLAAVAMRKYPATADVDSVAANVHLYVRNDDGRTPQIYIRRNRESEKQ
jgi:hypothetical protein